MITSTEIAIAEAIRTGKPVEVRRADGSVRVVVSAPREDVPLYDDLRAENIRLRQLVSVLSDGNVEWEEECRRLKAELDSLRAVFSAARTVVRRNYPERHGIGDQFTHTDSIIFRDLAEAVALAETKGTNRE